MKQDVRHLPDMDLRGRRRRHLAPRTPRARKVTAKLFGGPLDGRTFEVPASTERIAFGPEPNPFWVYTYAGKEGTTILFAKQPRSRVGRRFITFYIRKFGKHPGVESQFAKRKPFTHGSAFARRIARRKRVNERKIAWKTRHAA